MDIQYILFDLDDTLYTDNTGLFVQVGNRIHDWTHRTLTSVMDEAERVPATATIKPMARRWQASAITTRNSTSDDFLDYVHDVDVTPFLDPAPELDAMLRACLRRKVGLHQ